MKRQKIYNIAAACALLLATASCGSDYLNVKSGGQIEQDQVYGTTTGLKNALNGISRLMTVQMKDVKWNGEGSIKTWYGNFLGNDYYRNNYTALAPIVNGNYMQDPTSQYDEYPWFYYYKLISNANPIIMHALNAQGEQTDKQFVKAQALTYRAYSYMMLVQIYAKRWSDSNNGATSGVVLRLDDSNGDIPLSTLAQCYEQIYSDLDEAIRLYKASGEDRGEGINYLPNINAAYAVYARAAINREDWTNAKKYAQLAREGYPLMSNQEYKDGGFNTANPEWIWSVYSNEQESIYYYQFFACEGSNTSYSSYTSRPAGMSKELYNQIPATDIRREMFLDPKSDKYTASNNYAGASLKARAFRDYGTKLNAKSYIFAYMQLKQQAKVAPGVGEFNLFRSAEMYLIEAEADCHLHQDAEAQALLVELNKTSGRDIAYTCTKTGEDLLNEVRLYYRIELWGEGHDWFNYKRWGLPIERHDTKKGGSFPTNFAITVNPEDKEGWTWVIPNNETEFNPEIDKTLE